MEVIALLLDSESIHISLVVHRKEKSILPIWRNSWRATLKILKLNCDYVVSSREREYKGNIIK